jgi:hypothetical protein
MIHELLNIEKAPDEFQGWARECQVLRNQGWRNGIVTHRMTNGDKTEYVTYAMPKGKVYKVAIDMIKEQKNNTLIVKYYDIVIIRK